MRVVLPMPGNEAIAASFAQLAGARLGAVETRRFPDGEIYVRLASDVRDAEVDVVCTLARPDEKVLGLFYVATTARELGAARVNLIAPYLAYMRQDKRFLKGEAISSRHFAHLLSLHFDGLVTIDPHLHRHRNLGEIFSIQANVEHAAPLLADWIGSNVQDALVIGPDAESEQWVSSVAEKARAPHVVMTKERFGDRHVAVTVPDLGAFRGRRPVLVDDIASSGRTMIEAARQLSDQGLPKPYCIVVHPLFADDSYRQLSDLSERVVSTNTAPHPSNEIDIVELLVRGGRRLAPGA